MGWSCELFPMSSRSVDEMDDSHFMKDPSQVFRAFIGFDHRGHDFHRGYEAGIMGMALELITVAKTVEALPTEDPATREEVVSTIYTLLNGMELTEQATLWYERVAEWRKPKFEREPSHGDTSDAAQLSLLPRPPRASGGVSPLGEATLLHRIPAQPDSDQSQGPPSSWSDLMHYGVARTTPSESPQSPGGSVPQADD